MPHFTKRLQTDFGNPEFIFDRIFTVGSIRYHAYVKDKNKKSIFFNMEVKEGVWFIVDSSKVPDWIVNLQSELSNAIIEHKPSI